MTNSVALQIFTTLTGLRSPRFWFLGLVFLLAQGREAAWAQKYGEDPLQVSATLKPTRLESNQIGEVELKLTLPEQYKAYEEQFHLELETPTNFKLSQFTISPVHAFWDEFSKKNRRGIVKKATLRAPIEAPAELPADGIIRLRLTYQACTKSYCLFPLTKAIEISFQGTTKPVEKKIESIGFFAQSLEQVFQQGLIWTFVFVFFAGVLTSLTPCIYPIVPITIAVLSRNSHMRTKWQSFILSNAYVFGIAITYALLGLIAASTGALFGNLMTSPWVLGFVCLVFLAMALSMLGLYDIQPPAAVESYMNRFTHFQGPLGAFLTGVVSGLVASPCVGPALVGILTYVARTQNLWLGFWLLFVFAIGMGQLFLFLGLSTHLTKKLPKSGPWLEAVKKFSGVLLLAVFYYYLGLIVPQRWFDGALGLGLIVLGSLTYAFDTPTSALHRVLKGACQAVIFFGAALLVIAAFDLRPRLSSSTVSGISAPVNAKGLIWPTYNDEALAKSLAAKRPVIIDFSAEWCAACKELDELTYTNDRVKQLAANFDLYKFDATEETPAFNKLRDRYKIVGLPWVIFIDQNGKWLEDSTLAGFEEAAPFAERMTKALK